MIPSMAIIVRCAGPIRDVVSTLDSVQRQTVPVTSLVLVTDDGASAETREYLAELARVRGALLVQGEGSPAAARNAGITAVTTDLVTVLDAGDVLDSWFVELCLSKAVEDPDLEMIATELELLGPGRTRRVITPPTGDLDVLLESTDTVQGAFVLRRAIWTALNGFDDTLPCLEEFELWIRFFSAGYQAALIERPLVMRTPGRDPGTTRGETPERLERAVASVIAKHRDVFGRVPSRVLLAREQELTRLRARHRQVTAARVTALKACESLSEVANSIREELPPAERETNLGDARRMSPFARTHGREHGVNIDRLYVERFMAQHAADIRGAVLELGSRECTTKFGGNRVTTSDVADHLASNPLATVLTDLRCAANIAPESYDCVILTEMPFAARDMAAAWSECERILRPNGVLLAGLPATPRPTEEASDVEIGRLSELELRHVLSSTFSHDGVELDVHGNLLVTTAHLYGMVAEDISQEEWAVNDPHYPVVVTIRARKPASRPARLARTVVTGQPAIAKEPVSPPGRGPVAATAPTAPVTKAASGARMPLAAPAAHVPVPRPAPTPPITKTPLPPVQAAPTAAPTPGPAAAPAPVTSIPIVPRPVAAEPMKPTVPPTPVPPVGSGAPPTPAPDAAPALVVNPPAVTAHPKPELVDVPVVEPKSAPTVVLPTAETVSPTPGAATSTAPGAATPAQVVATPVVPTPVVPTPAAPSPVVAAPVVPAVAPPAPPVTVPDLDLPAVLRPDARGDDDVHSCW